MQNFRLFHLLLFIFGFQSATSQEREGLQQLAGQSFKVYHSPTHGQRALSVSTRVGKALVYYQNLLGFKPVITLLVLSEADWSRHTSFPVYGMPHYTNDQTLVVAAEDNAFWQSFIPPMEQLPPVLQQQVQKTYTTSTGQLSMQAFFDLLALHELGHAFHLQDSLQMQRNWMGELFVNILLHTYIAENEKESLPALTLFPEMVIASGAREYAYTSLKDVHQHYVEIATRHPKNYGWYQSRWHAGAGHIYDTAGKKIGRKLWDALKGNKKTLADEELILFLEANTDPSVADFVRYWDRDTVR